MDTVLHAGLSNALVAAAMALLILPLARLLRRPALTHALCVLILVKLVTPPLWRVPVVWATPAPTRTSTSAPTATATGAATATAEDTATGTGTATPRPAELTTPIPAYFYIA